MTCRFRKGLFDRRLAYNPNHLRQGLALAQCRLYRRLYSVVTAGHDIPLQVVNSGVKVMKILVTKATVSVSQIQYV